MRYLLFGKYLCKKGLIKEADTLKEFNKQKFLNPRA
jgi:hypothetical protein